MKVLISVPGFTQEYQEIEYRVFNGDGEPSRVTARMPAQAFADVSQVDHVILLIPDSLGTGETYDRLQKAAIRLALEPFQKSTDSQHLTVVLDGDLLEPSQKSTKLHPFVLPSRYATHISGDIRDFYQAVVFFLSRWFAEHLVSKDDNLEIMVEASTGLNILQIFVYRAVREVAGVLAFVRDVTLRVYNSDPVRRDTQHADIFLTEEHAPLHATLARIHIESTPRWATPYKNTPHPGQDPQYRKIRDWLVTRWSGQEASAFLNAAYHGIPLGIVHWFCPQPEEIFQGLETLRQYVLTRVFRDPTTGGWVRPVRLGPDVAPYALGALLSRQLQIHWSFFTEALRHDGATYTQIETFMKTMYRHHPVILNRFLAERSIQPDRIACSQYPSLLAHCVRNRGGCRNTNAIDQRNFFAHAGFERCAVEVFQDTGGKVHFRYAEGAKDTIMRWLH